MRKDLLFVLVAALVMVSPVFVSAQERGGGVFEPPVPVKLAITGQVFSRRGPVPAVGEKSRDTNIVVHQDIYGVLVPVVGTVCQVYEGWWSPVTKPQACVDEAGNFVIDEVFNWDFFSEGKPQPIPLDPAGKYMIHVWADEHFSQWVDVPKDGLVKQILLTESPVQGTRVTNFRVEGRTIRFTTQIVKPGADPLELDPQAMVYSPSLGIPYGLVRIRPVGDPGPAVAFRTNYEFELIVPAEIPAGVYICGTSWTSGKGNPFLVYGEDWFCFLVQ